MSALSAAGNRCGATPARALLPHSGPIASAVAIAAPNKVAGFAVVKVMNAVNLLPVVSDRGTLGDVSQLPESRTERDCELLILKWRDVRVVVLLRGFHLRALRYGGQVAASAGHLAVARAGLGRERRRMKEHAWKLNPLARADAH